jgi:hypothetical protein
MLLAALALSVKRRYLVTTLDGNLAGVRGKKLPRVM